MEREAVDLQRRLDEAEAQSEARQRDLRDRDEALQRLQSALEDVKAEYVAAQAEWARTLNTKDTMNSLNTVNNKTADDADHSAASNANAGRLRETETRLQESVAKLAAREASLQSVSQLLAEAIAREAALNARIHALQQQSEAPANDVTREPGHSNQGEVLEWKKRAWQLEQANAELLRQVNDYKLYYHQKSTALEHGHPSGNHSVAASGATSPMLTPASSTRSAYRRNSSLESGIALPDHQMAFSDVIVVRGRNRVRRSLRNFIAYVDQWLVTAARAFLDKHAVFRVTLATLFLALPLILILIKK